MTPSVALLCQESLACFEGASLLRRTRRRLKGEFGIRVLLSAYSCDPYRGTEFGNGWNWAVNLTRLGHEVWVLTGDRVENEETRAARSRQAAQIPGLNVVVVDIPSMFRPITRLGVVGIRLHYLFWLRAALRVAHSLHRGVNFDLAHHVTWGSVWGSPLWRLGVPFIFGPVGGGQKAPRTLRAYFEGWWKEAIRNFSVGYLFRLNPSTRGTVRNAALVLATNSDTLEFVQKVGARRSGLEIDTAVPPNFLQADRVAKVADETMRIAWVGSLLPRKGLPLALEALRRIPSNVNWHLTVVGDGPQGPSLPAWLDDPRLQGKVDWLGRVDWSEVRDVYERSSLLLFTSLRDSSGAQLYEAMAFGLPVVALDHHGAHDLLPEEAAAKVPVGGAEDTAQGVADALESLARDPAKRARMSQAALDFAAQSTWETKVRNVYSEIEAILASIDDTSDLPTRSHDTHHGDQE